MGIKIPMRWNKLIKLKRIIPVFLIIALFSALSLFFYCFRSYGHLDIRVVDAYTLMPLEGARVIIPDAERMIISDSTGSCVFTGIPIRKNNLHQRLVPYTWGECTIIALYSGYRPTVILNARVDKDQMRSGPTVYMFPEELDDIEVAAIVESPDDEWISQLVEKYSG